MKSAFFVLNPKGAFSIIIVLLFTYLFSQCPMPTRYSMRSVLIHTKSHVLEVGRMEESSWN